MYDLQIFCLDIHLSDGLEHHHNLQIIFFYFVVLACGCRFVDSGYTMICRPGFSVGSEQGDSTQSAIVPGSKSVGSPSALF